MDGNGNPNLALNIVRQQIHQKKAQFAVQIVIVETLFSFLVIFPSSRLLGMANHNSASFIHSTGDD